MEAASPQKGEKPTPTGDHPATDAHADAPAEHKREKRRAPNRLIVDDAIGDGDNSCVHVSQAKLNGV